MNFLEKLFGGSIKDLILGVFDRIKGMSPEDRAKLEVTLQNNNFELAKIQLELEAKVEEGLQNEVTKAAEIITTEAKSESWLARNVRPLLLLLWGCVITVSSLTPLIARFWIKDFPILQLDPWVYKLTAIGYTGYVAFRSADKLFGGQGGSASFLGAKLDSKGD